MESLNLHNTNPLKTQQSLIELKRLTIYRGWFWSMRMKLQALTFFVIIFIFVTFFLISIYLLNIFLVIPILKDCSHDLHDLNSRSKANNHLVAYKGMLDGLFQINEHQVENIHRIYMQQYMNLKASDSEIVLDKNSLMDYGGINVMPRILVDDLASPLDRSHSFMCFTNKTNYTIPMDREVLINFKIQETMYSIGHIMDVTNLHISSIFYTGTLQTPEIYFAYPCTCFRERIYKLDIPNRPWFQKGIEIYNKTKFQYYDHQYSYPYLWFTRDKVEVTMVLPLIDNELKLQGVIASDLALNLEDYVIKSDENVYMVLLANIQGVLIYHSYNVDISLLPIYIFNTSITGYTKEDWNAILNTKQNNCSQFHSNINMLCLYNFFYNKELLISIKLIPKHDYVLMIFHDNTDYYLQVNQFEEDMVNELYSGFIKGLQQLTVILSICILISTVFIILIFSPIQKLTDHCKLFMGMPARGFRKQFQQHLRFTSSLYSIQLVKFFRSYLSLIRRVECSQGQKSKLCDIMENEQYPKKERKQSQIKLIIHSKNEIQKMDKQRDIPYFVVPKKNKCILIFNNIYRFQFNKTFTSIECQMKKILKYIIFILL